MSARKVGATRDANLDYVDKTRDKAERAIDCAANNGGTVVSIKNGWAQVS